jgi:folate-binding protein YgfZ
MPCLLDDFDALAIEGADAVAFAHSQFASDVAALAVRHWQWTSLLTPQGRVVVLALLLHPEPGRLLLLAPGRRAAELADRLRPFVLRRRVALVPTQPVVVGDAGGTASPVPAAGGRIEADGAVLCVRIGGAAGRALRVGAPPQAADAAAREAWRLADIDDGIPWLEGAAIAAWIPQALALDRLAAFSTRKGCYPGQEIVARTHFLGRNKRALRRGVVPAAQGLPATGTRLLAVDAAADGEAFGEVVCAARAGARAALLAVLREDAPRLLRPAGSATAIPFEALPPPATTGADGAKML